MTPRPRPGGLGQVPLAHSRAALVERIPARTLWRDNYAALLAVHPTVEPKRARAPHRDRIIMRTQWRDVAGLVRPIVEGRGMHNRIVVLEVHELSGPHGHWIG